MKYFSIEELTSSATALREGDGRWLHLSYVPSDLRCQVIP